jgi:hypothetical protein
MIALHSIEPESELLICSLKISSRIKIGGAVSGDDLTKHETGRVWHMLA